MYEEIPAARRTGMPVANTTFSSREKDRSPISPTFVSHEDVSKSHLKIPPSIRAQYETIDLIDPNLEYGIRMKNTSTASEKDTFDDPKYFSLPFDSNVPHHISGSVPQDDKLTESIHSSENLDPEEGSLQRSISSKTSTSSTPNSKKRVFDDPRYALVNMSAVKPHLQVKLSKSTYNNQGEHGDSETVTVEVPEKKRNREYSSDSSTSSLHMNTPVLPKQVRNENEYTFIEENRYAREPGHLIHIMGNSRRESSASS